MFKHLLGFREPDDQFAAYGLKMVNLFGFPAVRFRLRANPFLMMLRAFAFGLVFGGDPDPDADGLHLRLFHPLDLLQVI